MMIFSRMSFRGMKMVVIHSVHSFKSSSRMGWHCVLPCFCEQRTVGDVAGHGGHIERPVELVEALVHQAQTVGAARHDAGDPKRDQVAGEGQHNGEHGGVLQGTGEKNDDGSIAMRLGVDDLARKYTRGGSGWTVMRKSGEGAVPIRYFECAGGNELCPSGTTLISKSLGHSLPVTKSRSCAAS